MTLGSGNGVVTTNRIALTTGSVAAGAGTAVRLVLSASTDIDTFAEGACYSGFEQVQLGGTAAVALDLDLLAANNTIGTVCINNTTGTVDVATHPLGESQTLDSSESGGRLCRSLSAALV